MVDIFSIWVLVGYVLALVFTMLAIIFVDNYHSYRQRKQVIDAVQKALETTVGIDAAAVARAATDAAKVYTGLDKVAADKVAKAAADEVAKGSPAATVAKAATDAAKGYAASTSKAAAEKVAQAATDAAGTEGTGKPTTLSHELITLLGTLKEPPEGMTGEGRLAMTLGFVAIIGIVVIQLVLSSTQLVNTIVTTPVTSANNSTLTYAETTSASFIDVIKTVVTILSGAVTAMIGFYFGSKAASAPDTTTPSAQPSGSGGLTSPSYRMADTTSCEERVWRLGASASQPPT
jgi:hypothetical protein